MANRLVVIVVEPLPEGVWLGTSPDVPGLIVETETRDECVELSRELAMELHGGLEVASFDPRDIEKVSIKDGTIVKGGE